MCYVLSRKINRGWYTVECCTSELCFNYYNHTITTAPSNWQTYMKNNIIDRHCISGFFSIFALSASCFIYQRQNLTSSWKRIGEKKESCGDRETERQGDRERGREGEKKRKKAIRFSFTLNSPFCAQYVHSNVRWAGPGLWSVSFNRIRWMLLLVSVMRIEQMLEIDPYAVYDLQAKTEAHNRILCRKCSHVFVCFHNWEQQQKESVLWTCCFDFVCLLFFFSFLLLFAFAFIHSMRFHSCLVFRMRFMCSKWIAAFFSLWKFSFTPFFHSLYLRRNLAKWNGSSELNWIYIT